MGNTRPCMSVVPRMTTWARCTTPCCAEVLTEIDNARAVSANKLKATYLFLNILWSQIAAWSYRRAGSGRHGMNFRGRVALNTTGVNQGKAIVHLLHLILIFAIVSMHRVELVDLVFREAYPPKSSQAETQTHQNH